MILPRFVIHFSGGLFRQVMSSEGKLFIGEIFPNINFSIIIRLRIRRKKCSHLKIKG